MKKLFSAAITLLLVNTHAYAMPGNDFQPPKYNAVDENGINLVSGQVTASVNTVSIGDLNHSISLHTNRFNMSGNDAWVDSFSGSMQRVSYGNRTMIDGHLVVRPGTAEIHVMRVSAMGQSMDFKVMAGGSWNYDAPITSTNHTYQATGDTRHTLQTISGGRLWTWPDGTQVYFTGSRNYTGYFNKIVYPNGYTININSPYGVTTNTGWQLKYRYVEDHSAPNTTSYPGTNIPPDARWDWSVSNPKYIYGVNMSEEYCAMSMAHCSFSNDWPRATFHLPPGMPRIMWLTDTFIRVINSAGGETAFRYEPHDLTLEDPHNPSSRQIDLTYPRGSHKWPRLIGIKPPGSSTERFQYFYENEYRWDTYDYTVVPALRNESGKIVNVRRDGVGAGGSYQTSPIDTRQGEDPPQQYLGYRMRVITGENPNTLGSISVDNEITYTFEENNFRNFIKTVSDANGPNKTYDYDSRGNINRVTYPNVNGQSVVETAGYPTTCNNRKTCNQPSWTQDADGNRTYYSYHPQSGQIASVTYPANEQGLVAQTRFEYQQKYAYIKNSSNNRVRISTPLWLKTAERSCANSNFSDACQANDEVVTRYEYNHDNLLLTSMIVTANGQTLRTCYEYDIYGNQIGEIQPNANPLSCP